MIGLLSFEDIFYVFAYGNKCVNQLQGLRFFSLSSTAFQNVSRLIKKGWRLQRAYLSLHNLGSVHWHFPFCFAGMTCLDMPC